VGFPSCDMPAAKNFEMASIVLEYFCTPDDNKIDSIIIIIIIIIIMIIIMD